MDQSFSPRALQFVWDLQTRKGKELARLFPTVAKALEESRTARKALRRAMFDPATSDAAKQRLSRAADSKREAADRLIGAELEKVSFGLIRDISEGRFSWGLHLAGATGSRSLYSLGSEPATYFADKQLQRSIRSVYLHSFQSRHAIVASVARTLDNTIARAVVKADVEKFYDNVDHDLLLDITDRSSLSRTSKKLVRQLISEYAALTGLDRGLPTGVGLSAALAEWFIAILDMRVRSAPGVLYFARYVDDIVVVFGLESLRAQSDDELIGVVSTELNNLKLPLHPTKTAVYRSGKKTFPQFELLGYNIERSEKRMKVSLTQNRIDRLAHRLNRTFDLWALQDQSNTGRQGLFINRLRFITGNARLSNNKRNAMVGIYFSNPELTELDSLDVLDSLLASRCSTLSPGIYSKVSSLSFRAGFESKPMYKFAPQQLKKMRGAWNG